MQGQDDRLRLFDIGPLPRPEKPERIETRHRRGAMSEHLAIVALLRRGHNVAVPVVDDDGVDLVVDYRTTVQVKSSRYRKKAAAWVFSTSGGTYSANGEWRPSRSRPAQIYLCHAPLEPAWWIVPMRWLREAGFDPSRMDGFSLGGVDRGYGRYAGITADCRDAWYLLKLDWSEAPGF
jgi:hypothetical protein